MPVKYNRDPALAQKPYRSLQQNHHTRRGLSPQKGRSIMILATTLLIFAGLLHSSVMQRRESLPKLVEATGVVLVKKIVETPASDPRFLMEIEVITSEGVRRGTVEAPRSTWDRYAEGQQVWVDYVLSETDEWRVAIHRIAPTPAEADQPDASIPPAEE